MNLKRVRKFAVNKQIVLIGMVCIIVIAGIINWLDTSRNPAQETSGPVDESQFEAVPVDVPKSSDYFATAKLEREQSRSRALEILRQAAASSDAEERGNAQAGMTKIAFSVENEMIIEGLIKAKGFEDTVVYISDSGASVVVKTDTLTAAQTAQIKDIVTEKAAVSAEKIKIVSVK